jgi:hypothetical protein
MDNKSSKQQRDDLIEMQFTIPTYGEPDRDLESSTDTSRLNSSTLSLSSSASREPAEYVQR